MIKRLKTSTGVLAGIAALALGGSAIASAASSTTTPAPTHESTTAPDRDNIQSGSQTTPDAKDTAATAESAPDSNAESSGESVANNDGPGGHADAPGNPSADTQQQGQN